MAYKAIGDSVIVEVPEVSRETVRESGLVLLEAWANGVPVVCYRAGGPGELIHDGIDGRLVACGDLPGLTAAIETITPEMGEAGQRRLRTEFRWEDKLQVVQTTLQAHTLG